MTACRFRCRAETIAVVSEDLFLDRFAIDHFLPDHAGRRRSLEKTVCGGVIVETGGGYIDVVETRSFLFLCLIPDVGVHASCGFGGQSVTDDGGSAFNFGRRERCASGFVLSQDGIEICLAMTIAVVLSPTKEFAGLV